MAAVLTLLGVLWPSSSSAQDAEETRRYRCPNAAGHLPPGQCKKVAQPTTTSTTSHSTRLVNGTDVAIPSSGPAAESHITVSLSGNAPSTLKVGVDIKHPFRGDLVIDLIAPDGSKYRLKEADGADSADNVITTYTVDASSSPATGIWTLRVLDVYAGDSGYLDAWSLQF